MQKILTFYKEVKQEALKITWPTKPEVITTTIMVFIFVLISSIFFCSLIKLSRLVLNTFYSKFYVKLVYTSGLLW